MFVDPGGFLVEHLAAAGLSILSLRKGVYLAGNNGLKRMNMPRFCFLIQPKHEML